MRGFHTVQPITVQHPCSKGSLSRMINGGRRFHFTLIQYLEAGDSVIVIGTYIGLNRQTQKPLCAAAAHVYDLVDSKVCRFRMFADTKTIWDSMI